MVLQPGDHERSAFKDMRLHGAPRQVSVTSFQCTQDLFVVIDILLHAMGIHSPRRRIHHVAGKSDIQLADEMTQSQVVARRLYQGVKFAVRVDPGVRSFQQAALRAPRPGALLAQLLDRAEKGIVDPFEIIELIVADPLRSELGGESFKLRPHLVGFANLAGGRHPDDCAMPMSLRNDAFGFKKAERLPDGRAADAEFLGEQLLEKPVAGPVFPERNLGMNPLDDLVDKLRIGSRVRHSVISSQNISNRYRIRGSPCWIPHNCGYANNNAVLDQAVAAREPRPERLQPPLLARKYWKKRVLEERAKLL